MNNEMNEARTDKILIVDDTPANLQFLMNLLKEQGYSVFPASDGELALEFVRSTPPDLILLDIRMPGMDGYEVCRRLKADEQTRSIPIIFISVLEDERDKVQAFHAGGVDYITKPVRPEEVLARVGTHLRLRDLTVRLEQKVRDRTEELAEVNQQLLQEIDERKQAVQELTLLNFAMNNVHEAAFLIDADARFRYVNDDACLVLGYTRDELLNLSVPDVDPDFPTERWSSHWHDLEKQHTILFEGRYRANDGHIFPVEVSANYFEYEGRGYNLALVRDITERKHSAAINAARLHLIQFSLSHSLDELLEETLNETELLTGSLIGFYHFVTDDQKNLTLQNWSTRTKSEFCIAEGKGRHYSVDQAGVWVDCIYQRRPVIHNDYISLPNRKGMPDGHAQVIRELVVPVFRGEKISAILGVGNKSTDYTEEDVETVSLMASLAWEIAERKRAEEALHRLNRELRAISSCNKTLLRAEDEQTLVNDICRIVCDEAGYRLAWVGYAEYDNEKTVRPVAWSGFDDGYVANAKLSWSDDAERAQGPGGVAIRSGKTVYVEDFATDPRMAPWRESALQRGYRSTIALPLKDENAKVFGVLLIYSMESNSFTPYEIRILEELAGDLAFGIGFLNTRADRKRAEEQLKIYHEQLEDLVKERTIKLEEANKELEAFTYSVSHDLRAPLRHIDGFMELLQQRISASLDEKSRHYMTTILDETKRMGLLIDDLLSFSRMGRQGLSQSQVDLNKLVQEIVIELESETKGRTINWHITGLPVVSADRTLIRAVLVNVISNAIKFTRPRAVGEIEIGSQGRQTESIIYVRDNGVGFDMQYVGKLFGVFQRLHSQEFEGTGIGLATAHRIITRHGGRVWAEGEVGHGATFYFSLPQSIKEG